MEAAAEGAIYFPNMRMPETPWFSQVLLYWDHVVSFAPGEVRENVSSLGRYMSQLVEAELVSFLPPDDIIMFTDSALNMRFKALLELYEPPPDRDSWAWTPLHAEKVNDVLLSGLMDRGLARRPPVRATIGGKSMMVPGSWFMVEKGIGDLYVAYLAGLACNALRGFFPVTDSNYLLNGMLPPQDNTAARLQSWRYAVITNALPVPSKVIPPTELASFKKQNRDKLRRLRVYLNGKLADLATLQDDPVLLEAKTTSVLQEITDDVAVLREQMTKRRWPTVALVGVAGIAASALSVGTAIASGGSALALGLGIGSAVTAMAPAAQSTVDVIRSPRIDLGSPLAYAVLAGAL